MSDEDKPVRVKNISLQVIFYENIRYRSDVIFVIRKHGDFSKNGKMVMIDNKGKEVRHLGGFEEDKKPLKEGGKPIRGRGPLKGKPVYPWEEVSQPTKQEKEAAARKERASIKLAEAQKELADTALAPLPDVELDEPSKSTPGSEEKVSDTNVI